MSRSSARRGQTEPVAALAAVLAVGVGLSLYAGALPHPGQSPDEVADATLSRVHHDLTDLGTVDVDRLDRVTRVAPDGYALNATLSVGTATHRVGPARPPGAHNATRRVSVGLDDGVVRPGRLTVGVWS